MQHNLPIILNVTINENNIIISVLTLKEGHKGEATYLSYNIKRGLFG